MSGGKTFPSRADIHRGAAQNHPQTAHGRSAGQGSHRSGEPKPSRWFKWGVLPAFAILIVAGLLVGAHTLWNTGNPPVLTVTQTLDGVHVEGNQGGLPVVTLEEPLDVEGSEARLVIAGHGRVISEGSPVLLSVTSYDAKSGALLNEQGLPILVLGHADAGSIGSTLSDIVLGAAEGSRFVVARELDSGATEINVVDVLSSIAQGTAVDDQSGPLTVVADESGFTIEHSSSAPPAAVTIQTLVEGSGPQVTLGDDVAMQFLAVQWSDGRTVSSTWEDGSPSIVDISEVMPGLREALVDQRVGSRLAVTIPPEKATGEDTLCIVVDILGVMPSTGTDLETDLEIDDE